MRRLNTCVCKPDYARIADDKCVVADSEECGGIHGLPVQESTGRVHLRKSYHM